MFFKITWFARFRFLCTFFTVKSFWTFEACRRLVSDVCWGRAVVSRRTVVSRSCGVWKQAIFSRRARVAVVQSFAFLRASVSSRGTRIWWYCTLKDSFRFKINPPLLLILFIYLERNKILLGKARCRSYLHSELALLQSFCKNTRQHTSFCPGLQVPMCHSTLRIKK